METKGIVPLSKFEIEMVSGGKSVVNGFWDSLGSWFGGLTGPPGAFSFPFSAAELADISRYVTDNGGSIVESGSLAAGTLNIRLTGADGDFTVINVTGIRR